MSVPKKRILVVDDEPFVCDAVKMMLAFDGHDVSTADDAKEALSVFEAGKFDLVITDPRGKDAPLLAGKPVVLATVRGGAYGAGTPREGWDHSTSYLRRILADVWGADLTVVEREFTLVGVNPALDEFTDVAKQLHAELALDVRAALGPPLGSEDRGGAEGLLPLSIQED